MRTLCLNVSYEPLGFLKVNRAVQIYLQDKVEILETDGTTFSSNGGVEVPTPLVVRLKRYIKMPRSLREAISPRVLFARDNHTCQYCGKHESKLKKNNPLTIDHIQPKSKDGPHHWENVVSACYVCNLKKRNRTPLQANMRFVDLYRNKSPKKPHLLVFTWGGRVNKQQEKWIKQYYKVDSLHEDIEGLV